MKADVLVRDITERLEAVSDCAAFEARCLAEHFCSLSRNDIYLAKEVKQHNAEALEQAICKRLQHVPVQYLLGEWEFLGERYFVNEHVLIPRPETELLAECLLETLNENSVVYDLCAETGCVGISLAKSTGAQVYAVEKYASALEVLERNIAFHEATNVKAVQWDITLPPPNDLPQADVIVSNPPYIESADIATLQAEVQKEPHTALDGGADGLDFYRAIAAHFLPLLKAGGYIAVEIGEGQVEAVKEIFSSLQCIKVIEDYNNIARVVMFGKEY